MADQAMYFDQALEENVQRVVRGMDGQCLEAKQHFEDERDARSDLLDAMYEDLLAKFLADTEVLSFANLGLIFCYCASFGLCSLFYVAAIVLEVQGVVRRDRAQKERGGLGQHCHPRVCHAPFMEGAFIVTCTESLCARGPFLPRLFYRIYVLLRTDGTGQ